MKKEKKELLSYIGNLSQLGGTRHYNLSDGPGLNMRAIDVNTGSGLTYTVLPDRGMDISFASFKGTNLVYITPNGETHPAFYEPEDLGWLRTFTGGLLTTCGLTWLGPPVKDGDEELGLHGRYSTIPAKLVADLSQWTGEDYLIKLRGTTEEARLFGTRMRLEREISSIVGSNSLTIKDTVTNFGYRKTPYTILYHINIGYPMLSEDARLVIDPVETVPATEIAASAISEFRSFTRPQPGFFEHVFYHKLKAEPNGDSKVRLENKKIGIALEIKYNNKQLPYLTQWKMMGQGDYVLGLEPCNVPTRNRVMLREQGLLKYLEAGESVTNEVVIGVSDID
jgi:galactose mutarotase-like enzyme